jgi:hypothetical protein
MKTIVFCFVSILAIVNFTYGETPAPKWGEVSKEELEMTSIPADSTADAVILFDDGYITPGAFGESKRVKVFTVNGTQYANVSIPFFSGEEIKGVEGYTITKDGKKFLLDSKQVFTKKGKIFNEMVFALPKVEEGSVFEYRYVKQTFLIYVLGPWYFQNKIFTKLSKITLSLKPWHEYNYEFVNRGKVSTEPEVEDLSFGKIYTWTLENVLPYKEEPYVACINDYRTAIYFESAHYKRVVKNVLSHTWEEINTWEEIGSWADSSYESSIKKHKFIEKKTIELIRDISPDSARARKVYDYVRQNIKWNGRWGIFNFDEKFLKTISSSLEGTATEKNLLLLCMLREGGVQAHPVLIRTRSHGKINKNNPKLSYFNHVIVRVKVGEQEFFLDAADKLYPFGMLPAEDLVPYGLLLDGMESHIIELPPAKVVGKKHVTSKGKVIEDGRLECNVAVSYQGYQNVSAREQIEEQGKEKFANNEVLSFIPTATMDSVTYTSFDSVDRPLEMRFTLSTPQYAQAVREDFYVNPILFTRIESNPFKRESRTYPIDFPYPSTKIEETEFLIPDDFEVKELPSNVYKKIPGATFSKTFSVEGNLIKCIRQLDLSEIVFPVTQYQALRSFFQEVVSADQQLMIVTKKQK